MKSITCLWLALSLVVVAGCRQAPEPAKEKIFDIKGTVLAVDLTKPAVRLDHQDIPGLMMAMVMEFDAANLKVIEGLKAGDKVAGKVKKTTDGNLIITRLDKLP